MPSIEIICIGQLKPVVFDDLPVAVDGGTDLKSHRIPKPLFREEFAALEGCMYHLGNPDLKKGRAGRLFFAWELLSDHSRSASRSRLLEFRPEFVPALNDLLRGLLELSPRRQLLFTSDYQFGPKRPYRSSSLMLDEFWALHSTRKLRLNSSYPICG